MRRLHGIIFALLLAYTFQVSVQIEKIKDPNQPMTFYGLDFSLAAFQGDWTHFHSAPETQRLIESMNTVINTERKKFDVAKMLHRTTMKYDINVAKKHNNSLDVAELLADSLSQPAHLVHSDLAKLIQEYDLGPEAPANEVGILFVGESFSKKAVEGWIWIVFFDTSTREIIFDRRMVNIPQGFGVRNYWLGAVYAMMKTINNYAYDRWKAPKKTK